MGESLEFFYKNELLCKLIKLQKQKKMLFIFPLIWLFTAVILARLFYLNLPDDWTIMLTIVGMITIIVFYGIFVVKQFKLKFKTIIVKPLVNFVSPQFQYFPNRGISEIQFTNCQIFSAHNKYKSEDLIKGTVGKSYFEYSEINASYVSGAGNSSSKKKIFSGILLIADFNKHFKGKTFVRTDIAEKIFGTLIGSGLQKIFSKASLVKLENLEFEREFVVKSTDPVEARYILTPSLMERVMNLQRKYNKIQFSFIASKMYIAIPSNKDRFEPSIFKNVNNFELIKDFYNEITEIINIIEELNLNTRIWTKK